MRTSAVAIRVCAARLARIVVPRSFNRRVRTVHHGLRSHRTVTGSIALIVALCSGVVVAGGDDCNGNAIPDADDIASGFSRDCDVNGVPDECQPDCDGNDIVDICEILGGLVTDCNDNLLLDVCEPDCNSSGAPDDCDAVDGTSPDCNGNLVPDECEPDCNATGVPDDCDVVNGTSPDCNANGHADECDPVMVYGPPIQLYGETGWEIRAGDVNGDGRMDLVIGPYLDGLYLSLGNGDGTFGAPEIIDSLFGVFSIEIVDIDGDLDLDLAVGAFYSDAPRVAWYENTDGAGQFGNRHVLDDEFGWGSVTTADIDGDGDRDMLAGIAWWENLSGAGDFGASQVISDRFSDLVNVVAADLDGDGDVDAAMIGETGGVFDPTDIIWVENVDGDGEVWVEHPIAEVVGSGSAPVLRRSLVAGDADADGDLDVVAGTADGIFLFENHGAGDYGTPGANAVTLSTAYFGRARFADLDKDGDSDLVARVTAAESLTTDGTFWFENREALGLAFPSLLFEQIPSHSLDFADLDGNGVLDVLTAGYGEVAWYAGGNRDCNLNDIPDECDIAAMSSQDCTLNGTPDECEPDCNDNGVADSCDIQVGSSLDCTLDGIPDECQPDCNGNGLSDPCEIAAGTVDDCDGNAVPDSCQPDCDDDGTLDVCEIAAGTQDDCDLNGVPDVCDPDCDADGLPDACEEDCNVNGIADVCEIASGLGTDCDGDGVLDECTTAVRFEHVPLDSFGSPQFVNSGDLDGDGDRDIVASSGVTGVSWYVNDGAGGFGTAIDLSGPGSASVWPVDLDGDGDLDILSNSSTQPMWYENGDGNGSFTAGQSISPTDAASRVYPADLDGDGDLDVLETANSLDRLAWYENLGGATFGSRQTIDTPDAARAVIARDVDGDGDLDVICTSSNPPKVAWYENLNGLGSFGAEQQIDTTVSAPNFVEGADMDGDGDLDILFSELTLSGHLKLYRNLDGQGTFGAVELLAERPGGAGTVAVDLDADGDLDIVNVTAYTTAPSIVWLENLDGQGNFGEPQGIFPFAFFEYDLHVADLDQDGDLDILTNNQDDWKIRWQRNLGNDCNGNRLPDICEPDCNANAIADACDLTSASSADCDDNAVPDECDSVCVGDCDDDDDGCLDDLDCDPLDSAIWSSPGTIDSLRLVQSTGTTALGWSPPAHTGATTVWYDVLRSTSADDFVGPAVCLESDDADTSGLDAGIPGPGEVDFFLIRVQNACPGDGGELGAAADGSPRTGVTCP